MKGVFNQLEKEYLKGRQVGFMLTVLLPLSAAIPLIVFLPGDIALDLKGSEPLVFSVVFFSIAIGFMARLVLQRMASHVRRMAKTDRYRQNQLLSTMLVFYLLLLCPALWGMITYVLVKNIFALLFLLFISSACYFLLTPPLKQILED